MSKNKPKIIKWPPCNGRGSSMVVKRLILTRSERSDVYWAGICSCYRDTPTILSDILDNVDPRRLGLWISGSPPFLLSQIEKKLADRKGG